MKYEKFEGSLGEFLEQHVKRSVKFYTSNGIQILASDIDTLSDLYNNTIYTEKEEVWTDHLPVLCWVSRLATCDEYVKLVTNISATNHFLTDDYGVYDIARPVTQEEIDKMIWKK